jgi:hypothetical protein
MLCPGAVLEKWIKQSLPTFFSAVLSYTFTVSVWLPQCSQVSIHGTLFLPPRSVFFLFYPFFLPFLFKHVTLDWCFPEDLLEKWSCKKWNSFLGSTEV